MNREAVIATRNRLKLNEPTYCERRARYHDLYQGIGTQTDDPRQPLPLHWLLAECPFVARELRRQNRLRPGDWLPDPDSPLSAQEPANEPPPG